MIDTKAAPRHTAHPASDEADHYWVLREDQIDCLSSAVRMTLIDRLAVDGPMSAEEIARAISLKPTAVYHHLAKLTRCGLVLEAGKRTLPGAKKPQILYRTPAPKMRLMGALNTPELAPRVLGCVTATLRQADRDFAAGLNMGSAQTDGAQRNLGFFRLAARPNAATLEAINDHLWAIAELMWQAGDEGGPPISLAWSMAPLPDPERQTHEGDDA